jgi:glycosyltransferase involved in cell wall biosynthesis
MIEGTPHSRPRAAVVHPRLRPGGGSEAVALWLAMALKDTYQLSLISMGTIDLNALNAFYGTRLTPLEIKVVTVPLSPVLRNRFDALKAYPLERFCQNQASQFDVMISAYNVMDFHKQGIQFIADFSFDDALRRRFDQATPGFRRALYQKMIFRDFYLKLGEVFSRKSRSGWMNNLTVANSSWSQGILKAAYGINSSVIYPPVQGQFPPIPWEKREDGFVVLGRIEPEKRIERIVGMLERVRAKGFPFHIHIVGSGGNSSYTRAIQNLCARHRDWIIMEGVKGGREKDEFLAQHKYGISGRQNEPFGIAVAEMIRAGCIVWVPDGGGQVEIVDHRSLIYKDEAEAVDKIMAVQQNAVLQGQLLTHLKVQSAKYLPKRFISEVREIVYRFQESR